MAIISSRPSIKLVKTRWRKKSARTLAERAGVIGANVWKVALEIFKHLEKEGFRFGSDRQVTAVLSEFIAFLVQLADRSVYGRLSDADRAVLIGETAGHLATTMENNQLDLLGPGEYRKPFVNLLNARFEEYAGFDCPGGRARLSLPALFCHPGVRSHGGHRQQVGGRADDGHGGAGNGARHEETGQRSVGYRASLVRGTRARRRRAVAEHGFDRGTAPGRVEREKPAGRGQPALLSLAHSPP